MRDAFKNVAKKLPMLAVLGLTAVFTSGCVGVVGSGYGGYSGYDARGPYVTTPRFLVPPRSWRQPVYPQYGGPRGWGYRPHGRRW